MNAPYILKFFVKCASTEHNQKYSFFAMLGCDAENH